MRYVKMKKTSLFLIVILFLLYSGFISAEEKIIELKFKKSPVLDSSIRRTLQSLVKIQGSGQFCQDGLYLMTHYGNRQELFQKENQKTIDFPLKNDSWRYCSVFSSCSENSVVMGRNWDNQNVGSIIVNLYQPPNGFASVSFSRSIDLGFGHKDLEEFTQGIFANKLILAPFYAYDGINEHGLTVAVAGVRQITVKPKNGKDMIFITFLIRKILDQAKNTGEAANLVDKYIPFDLDKNHLNCHLLITDSSGRSVILEYDHDQWRKISPDKSWQVLTNKPIYNMSDPELRGKCWRYESISSNLEKARGNVDWIAGMKMMKDVAQKGTTWSVVYSPASKELHFSVYQNWDTIYHIKEM